MSNTTKASSNNIANYTEEEVLSLAAIYSKATNEEERTIAVTEAVETLGKTKASIIAKLSSLKLYVRPSTSPKSKKPVITKDMMVEQIAEQMQTPSELLPGLEKANKNTLILILKSLKEHTTDD